MAAEQHFQQDAEEPCAACGVRPAAWAEAMQRGMQRLALKLGVDLLRVPV